MKIGILTLPFNNNYGGYLQAYAMMSVLKQEGHEVELIYRQHNPKKIPLSYFIKNPIKWILGRPHGPLYPSIENNLRMRGKLLMPFVDKYIAPRTKPLYSSKQLSDVVCTGGYDYIVCGSDQLWRPDYVPNIEDFFLSCIKEESPKVFSYAASFGTDNPLYSEEQKRICGASIAQFAAVSLREYSGIDVINRFGWHTKTTPVVVLDPTMLLSYSHYNALITKELSKSSGKVFCYVLDESAEAKELELNACSIHKLEPYYVMDPSKWKHTSYRMSSIEDWLCGIRDAEFVVTDSFHGTVFSIIFNKPFVVYANKTRGVDRFETLLGHFGLLERMNPNDMASLPPIDWTCVNYKLEELKTNSIKFIKAAIKDE